MKIEVIEESDDEHEAASDSHSESDILSTLSTPDFDEDPQATHLRKAAKDTILQANDNVSILPDTLHQLLTEIIKPLFSTSSNPSLTSIGRKAHFKPPPALGGFTNSFDDEPKPWQNRWTPALLSWILSQYERFPNTISSPRPDAKSLPPSRPAHLQPSSSPTLKTTLESHYFLLNPPILHLIDSIQVDFRTQGLKLLTTLLTLLSTSRSTIHLTSNLYAVYTSTLTPTFHLLPPLTPEDESLQIFTTLFPAYLALIHSLRSLNNTTTTTTTTPQKTVRGSLAPKTSAARPESQKEYTSLLRHGILTPLSHLSVPNAGLTTSVSLTSFLLTQLTLVLPLMDVYSVRHFAQILPFIRGMCMDPFILVDHPPLVASLPVACLDVLCTVVEMAQRIEGVAGRVRERWWGEVLRGVVGTWCAVLDDEEGPSVARTGKRVTRSGSGNGERVMKWDETKRMCKEVVRGLGRVVGTTEWDGAVRNLVGTEEGLTGLFEEDQ